MDKTFIRTAGYKRPPEYKCWDETERDHHQQWRTRMIQANSPAEAAEIYVEQIGNDRTPDLLVKVRLDFDGAFVYSYKVEIRLVEYLTAIATPTEVYPYIEGVTRYDLSASAIEQAAAMIVTAARCGHDRHADGLTDGCDLCYARKTLADSVGGAA